MKIIRKIFIAAALVLLSSSSLSAQRDPDRYIPVDFSIQLKNMHLWRGLQVTNTATFATDLWVRDRSDSFHAGVWGGAGVTGEFREFDYYLSFTRSGFTVALWDIYNFSPDAPYNHSDIFNYKADQTGHFIDLMVAYRFQGSFPLQLGWATILHGRDRGKTNQHNLYSTYIFADYPILRHNVVDLDFGMAGAFAFNKESGSKANFYAKKAGIVNINLTASKNLQFGRYTLPLSVMAMWNPVNNDANIQLAFTFF